MIVVIIYDQFLWYCHYNGFHIKEDYYILKSEDSYVKYYLAHKNGSTSHGIHPSLTSITNYKVHEDIILIQTESNSKEKEKSYYFYVVKMVEDPGKQFDNVFGPYTEEQFLEELKIIGTDWQNNQTLNYNY